ncbi:MAG: type II secretion system protein [Anaerohalosphaera sp.]|nr:type II secretion system protein [Anaerohalosphaera sp.]
MKKYETAAKGFTIVELLTVMGVIAILMALLVPALGLVHDYAMEVQQSAQFHSIDVGLELFKTEFGSYPESDDNKFDTTQLADVAYCGANKLAEALVGQDLLGFHSQSEFAADGWKADQSIEVYDGSITNNLKERKPLYIDSENANVFRLSDIYGAANLGEFGTGVDIYNYVFSDVFSKKRSTGEKAGMPILYFRARTNYVEQDSENIRTGPTGIDDDIYYYPDNFNLLDLGVPGTTESHPLSDGVDDLLDFDSMIVNPQVETIRRPFRANSYILMSAGKDGLYGTIDDIFNFEKKE